MPGTNISPQALLIFHPDGNLEVKLWNCAGVPLAKAERAGLLLASEIMKARARLAHKKPTPREAGFDNSHEPGQKEVAQ